MSKNGKGIFIKEGFSDIRSVGTIASTSKFVARAMAPVADYVGPPRVIVELGVGTGSITEEIIKRLSTSDVFIGIDSNDAFLDICKKNIELSVGSKQVFIEKGFAQNIDSILKAHSLDSADEIVCTLPFRTLPKKDTIAVLGKVRQVLKRGGLFIYIRYITAPENKEVFQNLPDFEVVERTIVVRNIPPAEVIKMRKK